MLAADGVAPTHALLIGAAAARTAGAVVVPSGCWVVWPEDPG